MRYNPFIYADMEAIVIFFPFVGLLVLSRITQRLLNQFTQNLDGGNI